MDRNLGANNDKCGPSTSAVPTGQALVSFWDLVGAEREDTPRSMLELEAKTSTQSPNATMESDIKDENGGGSKVKEVDLTGESTEDREVSTEVSVVTPKATRRVGHRSRKNEFQLTEQLHAENGPLSLTKLFDKSILAELLTEDTRMDRLRRVVKRNDRHNFELMGPYTNRLWHQLSLVDDCILVDNRLEVPVKLRQAVLARIHQGHSGQDMVLQKQ